MAGHAHTVCLCDTVERPEGMIERLHGRCELVAPQFAYPWQRTVPQEVMAILWTTAARAPRRGTCVHMGGRKVLKDRAALGGHLARDHHASEATLTTHGFSACPCGCPGAWCILPKAATRTSKQSRRGSTTCRAEGRGRSTRASASLRAHGNAPKTNAAPPSPPLPPQGYSVPPSSRCPTAAAITRAQVATSRQTPQTPRPATTADSTPPASPPPPPSPTSPSDSGEANPNYFIPSFADDVDLTSLLDIDINRHVRAVARQLKCQERPSSKRQRHDLVQPLVQLHESCAADPLSQCASLAYKAQMLGSAYLYFHRTGNRCHTITELRQRMATFVITVSNGTFPQVWAAFTEGLAALPVAKNDNASPWRRTSTTTTWAPRLHTKMISVPQRFSSKALGKRKAHPGPAASKRSHCLINDAL